MAMDLIKASHFLLESLNKNASRIRQACLLDPRQKDELDKMRGRVAALSCDVDFDEQFSRIDEAFQLVRRGGSAQRRLPASKTVYLRYEDKNIILSDNTVRPQTYFKPDRSVKTGGEMRNAPLDLPRIAGLLEGFAKLPANERAHQRVAYVETEEDFEKVKDQLNAERFLAVGVENHSFRSYKGFICLAQVATATEIYVIDAMLLRHRMQELEFFSNPDVLKIMHGSAPAIAWLHRDYNLPVNSVIDTHCVASHLGESPSLQNLVAKHCGAQLAREFQMADWRNRPLPQEMLAHAANSVRHLFRLLSSLLGRGPNLEAIIAASHQETASRHAPPARSAGLFAERYSLPNTEVLEEVLKLRDFIARDEDESPQFVLTNRQVCQLVASLPRDQAEVFRMFDRISPLFKSNMNNFIRILAGGCSKVFDLDALKLRSPAGTSQRPAAPPGSKDLIEDVHNLTLDTLGAP